jgi:hypothetical protein
MIKLLGYSRGTSKKNGNRYCRLYVLRDFSKREKDGDCSGQKCEEIFAPEFQVGDFKESDVGKEISLEYDVVGDRAYLRNITVLK